jgi:hypothetical protein
VAEQPGPGLLPRLWSQDGLVVLEERELLRSFVFHLRHDLRTQFRVGAQYAVVTDHVKPWRRDERCDPRAEVERLQDERDRAVAPGLLEKVAKLAAGDLDQALLRDGRASDVPAQPLEARAVPSRYRDLGVHVDPEALAHPLGDAGLGRINNTEQGLACSLAGETQT